MGTKRRRNSKRQDEGASNNRRPRMTKDAFGRSVLDVIERERRNLQKASAVLASLSVAFGRDERDIDAGDVADVAKQLIDGVTEALDRVKFGKPEGRRTQQSP
jgi:hypothetical protein